MGLSGVAFRGRGSTLQELTDIEFKRPISVSEMLEGVLPFLRERGIHSNYVQRNLGILDTKSASVANNLDGVFRHKKSQSTYYVFSGIVDGGNPNQYIGIRFPGVTDGDLGELRKLGVEEAVSEYFNLTTPKITCLDRKDRMELEHALNYNRGED